jgi:hypothetical protein
MMGRTDQTKRTLSTSSAAIVNGLTEALRPRKAIDWIQVRPEDVAPSVAADEAQITANSR